jgi:HK97 family phage major capsid protein
MSYVEERKIHEEANNLFESIFKPSVEEIKTEQRKFGDATKELENKINKVQDTFDKLEARMNRPVMGSSEEQITDIEYRKAFEQYCRTGSKIETRLTETYNEDNLPGDQGGFLVIPEWANKVYQQVTEFTPMEQVAEVINVSSNLFKIPTTTSENMVANWVGELQARPQTNSPNFNLVNIEIKELYAEPSASYNILEDNEYDLENWMVMELAERFSQKKGYSYIWGDGVLQPVGTLFVGGGNTVANPLYTAVQMGETWGDGSELSADDLADLFYSPKTRYSDNASWFMNRQFVRQIRKIQDQNGIWMWQPGLQAGQPPLIMERPFYEAPDMYSVDDINSFADGAAKDNQPIIMFGDWRRAYTIANRRGIRTLRDELTVKGQVLFYTTIRAGANVKDYNAYAVLTVKGT